VRSAELKNIQAIMDLERETREKRSLMERIIDGVGSLASSPALSCCTLSVRDLGRLEHRRPSPVRPVSVQSAVVDRFVGGNHPDRVCVMAKPA